MTKNKLQKLFLLISISALLAGCSTTPAALQKEAQKRKASPQPSIEDSLDSYTRHKLDALLAQRLTKPFLDEAQTFDFVSAAFLGTPYVAHLLQGSMTTPEKLVIDFRGLDCFTYLDYVEALRQSTSREDFIEHLIRTRYIDGEVQYLKRKHFFSDWANQRYRLADDITAQLSPNAVSVEKHLNQKTDGSAYLPGLPVVARSLTYLPRDFIDNQVISRLRTGDYIGIYTQRVGLDVSHVGLFILTPNGPVFRHASSRVGKVVDSPFGEYVAKTPGIIVLRAKP